MDETITNLDKMTPARRAAILAFIKEREAAEAIDKNLIDSSGYSSIEEDNFKAGTIIGLSQEEQMQDKADKMGIDLTNPDVQRGIKLAQTGKVAAEIGVPIAAGALLGGPAGAAAGILSKLGKVGKVASTSKKALNAVKKSGAAGPITRTIADFSKGALAGAGSNFTANTGAAALSQAITGDADIEANMKDTIKESGVAGGVGGVLSTVLGPFIRGSLTKVGNTQAKKEAEEYFAEYGKYLSNVADSAGDDAIKTVKEIHAKRSKELESVTEEVNSFVSSALNKKTGTKLKDIDPNLKNTINKIVNSPLKEEIISDKSFKNILKLHESLNIPKPVPPKLTLGSNASKDMAKNAAALEAYKKQLANYEKMLEESVVLDADVMNAFSSIKSLTEKAKVDGATYGDFLQVVPDELVENAFKESLPDEFIKLNKNLQNVYEKWGSKFDPNFADINKVYDILDKKSPNVDISVDDAIKFLNPDNSRKGSLIQSFIKSGDIKPETIKKVSIANAAGGLPKNYFPAETSGNLTGYLDAVKTGGGSAELTQAVGRDVVNEANKNVTGKILSFGTKKSDDVIPQVSFSQTTPAYDPISIARGVSSQAEQLKSVLGNKADNLINIVNDINFTAKKINPEVAAMGRESEMVNKLLTGFDKVTADPSKNIFNINTLEAIKRLGPQTANQVKQSLFFSPQYGKNEFGQSGY